MGVRKSKTVLLMQKALVDLLEKKSISDITVKELCIAAGVNRSTFYCHFSKMEDLFKDLEKQLIDQIPQRPEELNRFDYNEKLEGYSKAFFEYIHENAGLFKIVLNREDSDFKENFVKRVMGNFCPDKNASYITNLAYCFSVYGTLGIIQKWIEDGFLIDDSYFSKLALDFCMTINQNAKDNY